MIKTIIVDDHVLFSQALRGLIDAFDDIEVIEQFENGKALQEHCKNCTTKPDLILMDVQMPVVNGIEATQWLKDNHPNIKVLALTMNDEEETILKMLRAGAKGYLLKDIHPTVLHQAISETISKGFYYTEQVTDTLLNADKIENKSLHKVDLKPRELELLKYTAQELTYKQIAEKMFLSPKTIDGYREKLFYKLDVKSRVGLVLYAIKEGMVD
ncbi:MAG: response regulator transcription factor [Flavobacteriaceae bacterium]